MTITGLDNDNYLFNNIVNVQVDGFTSLKQYLQVVATNNYNGNVEKLRYYPINNTFFFDISPLVKSTFDNPNLDLAKNINTITLDFEAFDTTNNIELISFTKTFVRGGNFKGEYPNGTLKNNYLPGFTQIELLITSKVPIFDATTTIHEITGTEFTPVFVFNAYEQMHIPCNGKYIKFLNSFGTYSYWYFENYEEKIKTNSLELISRNEINFLNNNFDDLGVNANREIELMALVPERYNEIIKHLIISPEVYIVTNNNIKIKQTSNTWVYNPTDKMFEYKLTFEYDNVINPSLLC